MIWGGFRFDFRFKQAARNYGRQEKKSKILEMKISFFMPNVFYVHE